MEQMWIPRTIWPVLTTYHQPAVQQFTTIRDTSAGTASIAGLMGKMMAASADLWPESIRGLVVHSARWTPPMRLRIEAAHTRSQRVAVLRRYGYGVPDYTRALLSSINDVTLVAQDQLQPFTRCWAKHNRQPNESSSTAVADDGAPGAG